MSRTHSAASSVLAQTTGHRRNPSMKASANASEPPNVALFVTNLRLLDLDKRPDWPCITMQTFSMRDAQQSQKARIRCVEWALYKLFELWDAAEARNKLQPFFPPLEPLQSLNLRAALYRSLNELKKNGILGRDSILRKTMLDECKGDKFIEVLILFSTAVLKRVITAQKDKDKHAALSKRLATATGLSPTEQESLLPLVIAHKASLTALLQRKAEHRARYNDLDSLLEEKGLQIAERTRRIEARLQDNALHQRSNLDAVAIKKQLRENWLENTNWLNVVLHGDSKRAEDGIFELPFVDIWSGISKDKPLTDPSPSIGLLEALEVRVKDQKHRLQRWQAFHAQIRGSEDERQSHNGIRQCTFDVKKSIISFNGHQGVRIGNTQNATSTANQDIMLSTTGQRYHSEVFTMREELSRAAISKHGGGSGWGDREPYDDKSINSNLAQASKSSQSPQKASGSSTAGSKMEYEVVRKPNCASSNSERLDCPFKSAANRGMAAAPIVDLEPKSSLFNGEKKPQTAKGSNRLSTTDEPLESSHTEQMASIKYSSSSSGERTVEGFVAGTTAAFSLPVGLEAFDAKTGSDVIGEPAPEVYLHPNSPSLSLCNLSYPSALSIPLEEEHFADQIVASVTNDTPSPVKQPRFSLMERARMSMAHRMASSIPDPIDGTSSDPAVPDVSAPDPEPPDRHTSLVERTRQSMIRLSSQSVSHRNRKHNRKSSTNRRNRTSLYPVNQFETPRKEARVEEVREKKDPTPEEHLFAEDAEYTSVFKSRPKVAISPVLSPGEEEGLPALDGMGILELSTGSGLTEESWKDSPPGNVRSKDKEKAPRS